MRVRVTLVATVAAAVVLVVAGALLVALQRDAALGHLDELLSDEAEAIGSAVREGTDLPTLYDDDRVLMVTDSAGRVLMSAGQFGELRDLTIATPDDQGIDITFAGEVHRVVSESWDDADGGTGQVVLAEPRDELDDGVDQLIRSLVVIVPIAVGLLGLVVWFVSGRTLRPVERLRSQVAAIGVTELDRRVSTPPGHDEVARLAGTLNDMLGRLERSVTEQQRFVADASHELRTPLTRMRTQLEIDERNPDQSDPTATRRAQLRDLHRIQAMLDDLLFLARGDASAPLGPVQAVDLDEIVLDDLTAERQFVGIDASGVSAAQVIGVPSALHRVVRNLLDNAVEHARARVAVTLAESDGDAVLMVDDDGPGVPIAYRNLVFERFVQLDEARTATSHHGLGLAIVADTVRWHGGSIDVVDAPIGGARFRVRIPLAPESPKSRHRRPRGAPPRRPAVRV